MGVEADIHMREGYAATVNNEAMVALVRAAGAKVLGGENVYTAGTASMGAEDFGYFCEAAPGCYYRFGVGTPGVDCTPVHNAGFKVDLNALPYGAAVYAQIAEDFLNRE